MFNIPNETLSTNGDKDSENGDKKSDKVEVKDNTDEKDTPMDTETFKKQSI